MAEKPDLSKRCFLVVDDEVFMLDVIASMLRRFHVGDVIKSSDGMEALDTLRDASLKIDCIIADFNMKPVNGLQLLQKIRTGKAARVPRDQKFIMLTGNSRSEVVKSALLLDVDAYLVKPVAATKLGEALQRVFSDKPKLKSAELYGRVNIGVSEAFNDAEDKRRPTPIILSSQSIIHDSGPTTFLDRSTSLKLAAPDAEVGPPEIRNVRRCKVSKLKEKMILGEDVVADDGTVLIRKGTGLSKKLIFRLQKLAAESDLHKLVLVGDLA